MSITSALLGLFGLGSSVDSVIKSLGRAFDNIITTDEERLQAAYLLEKLRTDKYIIQAEINKNEAKHKSIFVAGWRPFIGWVAGLSFCFATLIAPILNSLGITIPIVIPVELVYNMLLALLGIGGLRTYEKIRNVDTKNMGMKR